MRSTGRAALRALSLLALSALGAGCGGEDPPAPTAGPPGVSEPPAKPAAPAPPVPEPPSEPLPGGAPPGAPRGEIAVTDLVAVRGFPGMRLGRTEVTNDAFARFVSATGHRTVAESRGWSFVLGAGGAWRPVAGADWRSPQGPGSSIEGLGQHPVVHVAWFDARAFARWAGGRLPREAEFEAALRGGSTERHPWGHRDFPEERIGNYADGALEEAFPGAGRIPSYQDGFARTAPVGSFSPGSAGASDLSGNVWEWCEEPYGDGAPAWLESRVLRGGSWRSISDDLDAHVRVGSAPRSTFDDVGFRCAWDVP